MMTSEASKSLNEEIDKALCRAFSFGETYWQQADSESYVQNKKSSITLDRFRTFKEETLRTLRADMMTSEADTTPPPRAMLWNRRDEDKLSDYPPLPTPDVPNTRLSLPEAYTKGSYSAHQMRAYADEYAAKVLEADRTLRAGQSEPTNPVQVSTAANLRRDAAQDPSCVGAFARARPGCKP